MEIEDSHTEPQADAGWYPDHEGRMRYWDGSSWLNIPSPPQSEDATPPSTPVAPPRRTRRSLIALSLVVVLAVAGFVGWKAVQDRREEAAAAAAALVAEEEAAAQAAEEEAAAQAAEEERIAREEAVAAATARAEERERKEREATIEEVEDSISSMAEEHLDDGIIEGDVQDVTCSPVSGGSLDDLDQRTTVLECFAATEDNGDGTWSGYYYNSTVNWDTGVYTYGLGKP